MRLRLFALLSCAVIFGACSDDSGTDSDTGTDTGTDTADASGDVPVEDTTPDADDDADTADGSGNGSGGWDEAAIFFECEIDDDCEDFEGQDQVCVRNVCVIPPVTSAYLVDEEDHDNVVEHPEMDPETGCYEDLFSPAGEDRTVTLVGMVERFGSGPTTESLCMTFYDEATLLPWLVNSECHALADFEENDTDAKNEYVGCFALDPCRCQEHFDGVTDLNAPMIAGAEAAMEAAGTPMAIDDLDSCYSFIGFCSGIEDATEAEACRARVAANGLAPEADSLVFGYTQTRENTLDSVLDEPEGTSVYLMEDVPTNWRFAVKVSGRENRWRDTWEYGQFTRGDLIRSDWPWFTDGVTDPEARDDDELLLADLGLDAAIEAIRIDGTAVSAGAWATIPPAVGLAGGIDDTHGAVAGVIRDCGNDGDERNPWAVVHARVGISFNQGSRLSYFNGNFDDRLPNPARIDTNIDGTFAAIDLPPGPNRVAPVICANDCSSREDYVFAGAKNVFQTPRSVIIATFEGFFLH
jgi:hypothetical protein